MPGYVLIHVSPDRTSEISEVTMLNHWEGVMASSFLRQGNPAEPCLARFPKCCGIEIESACSTFQQTHALCVSSLARVGLLSSLTDLLSFDAARTELD